MAPGQDPPVGSPKPGAHSPVPGQHTPNTTDTLAKFRQSVQDSGKYPHNLIRTSLFNHSLDTYKAQIDRLQVDVFHPSKRLAWIYELPEGEDAFLYHGKDETALLIDNGLNPDGVDPRCRYIFLQSENNRAQLGCTRRQLENLLTHHQVSPYFLDILLTFRKRETPSLFTMFRHENHISSDNSEHAIPSLGRSGIQLEHCFNLLSVEHTDPDELIPWSIRQTAAYVSFDITKNKTVWIIVKGNRVMRDRAKKVTEKQQQDKSLSTREGSLNSILAVHTLIMEWSVENWHSYIDSLEQDAARGSNLAGAMNLDQVAGELPARAQASRRATVVPSAPASRLSTFNSWTGAASLIRRVSSSRSASVLPQRQSQQQQQQQQHQQQNCPPALSHHHSSTATYLPQITQSPATSPTASRAPTMPLPLPAGSSVYVGAGNNLALQQPQQQLQQLQQRGDYNGVDRVFNFDEVQRLTFVRRQMAEAVLAIGQNRTIIGEIREHYSDLRDLEEFRGLVDMAKSISDISRFLARARTLEVELEKAADRLTILLGCLDNDLQLRYGALQFKSAKWGEFFAESAQTSTDRMEDLTVKMHDIATKTKQETLSMHFITVLTLIFLPGTFLATFFSSGIFHWNEEIAIDTEWRLRGDALCLFAKICVPMMLLVLIVWVCVYKAAGGWRRKKGGGGGTSVEPKLPV